MARRTLLLCRGSHCRKALRRDGRTLVVVTHEIQEAAAIADAALVLARGRLVHRAEGEAIARGGLEDAARLALESAS